MEVICELIIRFDRPRTDRFVPFCQRKQRNIAYELFTCKVNNSTSLNPYSCDARNRRV